MFTGRLEDAVLRESAAPTAGTAAAAAEAALHPTGQVHARSGRLEGTVVQEGQQQEQELGR